MAGFTSISPTKGNLGSSLNAGNVGTTTISDFPAASRISVYLEPKYVANRTPLLASFMGYGEKGSKELSKLNSSLVEDIKFLWPEQDDLPVRWVVSSVTGGSDYMLLDSTYGITPGMRLKNLRTDDVITVTNMSSSTTALTAGADLGGLTLSSSIYVFYSGTDPVAGDELVSIGIAQSDEGNHYNFPMMPQPRIRYQTMSSLIYPFQFSNQAAAIRTAGFDMDMQKQMAYKHFITQVENCLILGEATSTTSGGTASVSEVAVPSYNNRVELTTVVQRTGMGIMAQLKNYGFSTSFSGGFDFESINDIFAESSRKGGYRRFTALCGADVIESISRYQDDKISGGSMDKFAEDLSTLYAATVKTVQIRNGAVIDLVEHPALTESKAHRGTMLAYPQENYMTVQLKGYGVNGWEDEKQAPHQDSKLSLARWTGAAVIQDCHNSGILITDIG